MAASVRTDARQRGHDLEQESGRVCSPAVSGDGSLGRAEKPGLKQTGRLLDHWRITFGFYAK